MKIKSIFSIGLSSIILFITNSSLHAQKEVMIGKQIWMQSNLNVNKFRNGDFIPEAKTPEEWKKAAEDKKPAWCHFENNKKNSKKFGKLYNYYAVIDPRGLAPNGWHIPTDNEWTQLTDFLGGANIAGNKMRSTSGWVAGEGTQDANGTDESGFCGKPGGHRYSTGGWPEFGAGGILGYGYWWSSSENDSINAWIRYLVNGASEVIRVDYAKANGFSVRCVKD